MTTLRICVTKDPVTTSGSLLSETHAMICGLDQSDQDRLVAMARQAVRENGIEWYHVEQSITEAHTGAQGIGSEIVLWVTTNADAIAAGILSNLLFSALQANFDSLKVSVMKKESVNYMERAECHRVMLEQLTGETHLHLETIRANRQSVVYVFAGNTRKYEVEEQGDDFSVKQLVV